MSEPGYVVMPVQAEYGHHSEQGAMNAASAVEQSLQSQSRTDMPGNPNSGMPMNFGLGSSGSGALGSSSIGPSGGTTGGHLSDPLASNLRNSTSDSFGHSYMGGSDTLNTGRLGGPASGGFGNSSSGLPGASSGSLGSSGFDTLGTSGSSAARTRYANGLNQQQEHVGPLKKAMANTDSLYKYLNWQDPLRTVGSYFGVLTLLFGLHYFPLTQLLLKGGATLLGVMTVASFAGRSFSANSNTNVRPTPRQYAQVPEATLNATLRDVHDFVQYAVVEVQRIVFGEDLNRTFAAFIGCTGLYWSIKFLTPFWLTALGITSVYIGTLAASPRGRQVARDAGARAGSMANTAAEKGKVMAQSGQEQAAALSAKARGTAVNAQQTVADAAKSGQQAVASTAKSGQQAVADTAKSGQQTASNLTKQAMNTSDNAASGTHATGGVGSRGNGTSFVDRSSNHQTTSDTTHSILHEDDTNYSISSRMGTERFGSGTSDNLSSHLGNTPGSSFDSTSSQFKTSQAANDSVPRFGTATIGQPSTSSYTLPDNSGSRADHFRSGTATNLGDNNGTNPFLTNSGLGATGGVVEDDSSRNTAADVDAAKRTHNTVSVGRTDV